MQDLYKKLHITIGTIIDYLKEFDNTKNDLIKKKIRPYQVEMVHLSKVIGGNIQKLSQKLSDDIDIYLSIHDKEKFLKLIEDAIKIQNNLWEL